VRCAIDIQIKREFPVVEHCEEHRVVPTMAQAGQCAAQSLRITKEITQDHEECAMRGLCQQLIDAHCGREACLDWFRRETSNDRSPLVTRRALAHGATQAICADRHAHPIALA